MGNGTPLFHFEHVGVAGTAGPRLVDVDTAVPDRGVTAVIGPSGSGKSTLLRLCNRLECPSEGTVRFRSDDVAAVDPRRLRRRVGMVFQVPTPFPGTVRDNLEVAEPELSDGDARAALERADLPGDFLDRVTDELSAGEAQRVCLARTLATRPEVLLMDEPTSSVDPRSRHALEDMTTALARDGVPVLWVTHDHVQARRIADHVLVLVAGKVEFAGSARDAEPYFDEG
ncbi:MAG: ABC transporter ATP-binding protein [Actinomycetota bacterium]